jgi:hypothetical protein
MNRSTEGKEVLLIQLSLKKCMMSYETGDPTSVKGRIPRSKDNKLGSLHVRRNKLAEVKEALSIASVEGKKAIVELF